MHIHLEATDNHSIEAYSDTEIKINSIDYHQGLIVSRHEIISPWLIDSVNSLTDTRLQALLTHHPEIILIGHKEPSHFAPGSTLNELSRQRIALESMSIGAACRTFNVLLNEGRAVVLGIIF